MYGLIRGVLYVGGGLGIVYALINLFGNPLRSLIGFAVAAVLFFISRYVQPPQAEELPPPEIDMTTDYRKEMAKARKEHLRQLESGEGEKSEDGTDSGAQQPAETAAEKKD